MKITKKQLFKFGYVVLIGDSHKDNGGHIFNIKDGTAHIELPSGLVNIVSGDEVLGLAKVFRDDERIMFRIVELNKVVNLNAFINLVPAFVGNLNVVDHNILIRSATLTSICVSAANNVDHRINSMLSQVSEGIRNTTTKARVNQDNDNSRATLDH